MRSGGALPLPKAQKGNIVVEPDSLDLYREAKRRWRPPVEGIMNYDDVLKYKAYEKEPDKYGVYGSRQMPIPPKSQKIQPVGYQNAGGFTWNVIYAKPADIPLMKKKGMPEFDIEATPQSVTVPVHSIVPTTYKDMRGELSDTPPTAYPYTPEQLRLMGYKQHGGALSLPKAQEGLQYVPNGTYGNYYDPSTGEYMPTIYLKDVDIVADRKLPFQNGKFAPFLAARGIADYVPVEAALLPGTPAIKGLGKLGNFALDALNPLAGMRGLKAAEQGYKFEQIPLDDIRWENFKLSDSDYFIPTSTDKEVRDEALKYFNLTQDPRYLERVKILDAEAKAAGYKSNLEEKLKKFWKQEEPYGKNIMYKKEDFFPFNIETAELIPYEDEYNKTLDALGLSTIHPLNYITRLLNRQSKGLPYEFFPEDRKIIINTKRHQDENIPVRGTVHHELKHHWTNALADEPYYAEMLQSSVVPKEANAFLPRNSFQYYSNPTEIDAHLMTNMRDEMVQEGILKDHFDMLTKEKLDKFFENNPNYRGIREYFKPGQEIVWDRNKFVTAFNKALPAIVPGAMGLKALQQSLQQPEQQKQKVGGLTKAQGGLQPINLKETTIVGDVPERISQQNLIIQGNNPKNNYAIVNKKGNVIYYYNQDGSLIKSEPIITGRSNNDIDRGLSMKEWFDQTGSDSHEDYFKYLAANKYQTTPSGIYNISGYKTNTATDPSLIGRAINTFRPERAKQIRDARIRDYGEQQKMFTLQSEYGIGSSKAIHGTANPERVDALNTPGSDRNLSNGCVNLNGQTVCFDVLNKGSNVYILPEESSELLYPKNVTNKRVNKNVLGTKNMVRDSLEKNNIQYTPESLAFITAVAEKETKGGRSTKAKLEELLPNSLIKSKGTFQINPTSFSNYLPEGYSGSFDDQVLAVNNFFNSNQQSTSPSELYRQYSGDRSGKYSNKFEELYTTALNVYSQGGLAKAQYGFMTPPSLYSRSVPAEEEEIVEPMPISGYQNLINLSDKRKQQILNQFQLNNMFKDLSGKTIDMTTGRYRGAKVPVEYINKLYESAIEQGIDPYDLFALAARESTFASGFDEASKKRKNNAVKIVSGWNLAEDYLPYGVNRFLADRKVPGIETKKGNHGWSYHVTDPKAVEEYMKKNPELYSQYMEKMAALPQLGNKDAFDLAAQFFKTKGIAKYNPGDPDYARKIKEDYQLLKKDPGFVKYVDSIRNEGLTKKVGGLTSSKAREILHDKSVHGQPLTDKQRKFFGAIASGKRKVRVNKPQ
jgi:hypothetical protein